MQRQHEKTPLQIAHRRRVMSQSIDSSALSRQDFTDPASVGLALEKARLEALADSVDYVATKVIAKQAELEQDVEKIKEESASRASLPWYKRMFK